MFVRADEREVEQGSGGQQWQPPVIQGGREPLEQAAHHHGHQPTGAHLGQPDLQGGTHIPESELKTRFATVHTALRPENPDQPGVRNSSSPATRFALADLSFASLVNSQAMDGRPEPSTAGDDLAI